MSDPLQVGRSRKGKGDQQEGESQISVLLLYCSTAATTSCENLWKHMKTLRKHVNVHENRWKHVHMSENIYEKHESQTSRVEQQQLQSYGHCQLLSHLLSMLCILYISYTHILYILIYFIWIQYSCYAIIHQKILYVHQLSVGCVFVA